MSDSLHRNLVKAAHENPDLRALLVPILRVAQEEEGKKEPAKSTGKGRPGAAMVQFLEEKGDTKVRNPDTGNDVKIKSLKGEKGKKLLQEMFLKWQKKQEEAKAKGKGEKAPPKEEPKEAPKKAPPKEEPKEKAKAKEEDEKEAKKEREKWERKKDFAEYEVERWTESGFESGPAPDEAQNLQKVLKKYFDEDTEFGDLDLGALESFYGGGGWGKGFSDPDKMEKTVKRVTRDIDRAVKIMEDNVDQTGGKVPKEYLDTAKALKNTLEAGVRDFRESQSNLEDVNREFRSRGWKEATLRGSLVRLAYAHPELRPHLLPLIEEEAE